MVVCVECLPADKPWDVVSVTRRSSGVGPRACVRVYARVLVPPNLYIHTYIQTGAHLGNHFIGVHVLVVLVFLSCRVLCGSVLVVCLCVCDLFLSLHGKIHVRRGDASNID